jgi:uncharacterized protein involved in exopolysaccharide biosynthesis
MGTVAFGITSLLRKSYKSQATLYFPAPADATAGLAGGLASALRGGAAAPDKGGSVSLLNGAISSQLIAAGPQTAIAVLDSDLARQRVIDRLKLTKTWDLPNLKARKQLQGAVSFSVDKNGLLAMEAVDFKPELAQSILSAYIVTLRQLAKELSLNSSKRNREFVEGRVAETRTRIGQLEMKLLSVNQRDPDPVMSNAPSDAARGIVDLERDLVRAQTQLSAAESGLRLATENARALTRSGADLPVHAELGRSLRTKLAGLEYEFSLAKAELGPDNPRYRILQNQLNSARAQVRQEMSRENRALDKGIAPEVVKLSAEKAGYEAQVAGLDRAVSQVKTRLASIPARQMTKERLTNELKVMRGLLEYQATELVKAQIAEDRDATTFQVIDTPEVPEEPFAPRRAFTAAMAGVAGLLIGIALLVVRSSMRPDPLALEMERDVAVV